MTSIRGIAWTKAEKKEMWEQIQTGEQNQGHLKPEKWLGGSDQHQGESGVGPAVSTVSQNAWESKDLLLPTSLFLKVSVLLKCIEFLPWQVPQGSKLNPSSLRRKSERETSPEGSLSAVLPSAFICRLSDPTVNEGQLGPSQHRTYAADCWTPRNLVKIHYRWPGNHFTFSRWVNRWRKCDKEWLISYTAQEINCIWGLKIWKYNI